MENLKKQNFNEEKEKEINYLSKLLEERFKLKTQFYEDLRKEYKEKILNTRTFYPYCENSDLQEIFIPSKSNCGNSDLNLEVCFEITSDFKDKKIVDVNSHLFEPLTCFKCIETNFEWGVLKFECSFNKANKFGNCYDDLYDEKKSYFYLLTLDVEPGIDLKFNFFINDNVYLFENQYLIIKHVKIYCIKNKSKCIADSNKIRIS